METPARPPAGFELLRYLSLQPLFQEMTRDQLSRLAEGCTLQRLVRGEDLFREGDACEAFFVVVTGLVKLYVMSPNQQEKVIEIVSPGESFAEALMFTDRACIVSAQALGDSLLLRVAKETVFREIARDARFALRMLAGLSRRLHGLVHDVRAYALQNGLQRVIGYLLREIAVDDPECGDAVKVSLPVSKATIASRLSLTPEYFSRVMRELEVTGLISIDKREVHILDPVRLARYPNA